MAGGMVGNPRCDGPVVESSEGSDPSDDVPETRKCLSVEDSVYLCLSVNFHSLCAFSHSFLIESNSLSLCT